MKDAAKPVGRLGRFKNYVVENRHLTLMFTIIAIWLFFHAMSDGLFLSPRNMGTLFLQVSILGFVSVGVVSVMITRGIDLSVASTIGFLAVIGSMANIDLGLSPLLVCLIMLAVAVIVAMFFGSVVAYLGVPAFIVTLAGQLMLKGFYLIVSRGEEHAPVDESISALAKTWLDSTTCAVLVSLIVIAMVIATVWNNRKAVSLGLTGKTRWQLMGSLLSVVLFGLLLIYVSVFRGLPLMFVIMMAWAAVMHVVLAYTPFGRHVYAVGANPEAARLAGINPKRIIFLSFLLMGVAYFLSSLGTMARVTGFAPGIASNMELDAIAACVIGGTSLMGGTGTVVGAILGAILLSTLDNGMILLDVSSFWQYAIKGAILLGAVILDMRLQKNR